MPLFPPEGELLTHCCFVPYGKKNAAVLPGSCFVLRYSGNHRLSHGRLARDVVDWLGSIHSRSRADDHAGLQFKHVRPPHMYCDSCLNSELAVSVQSRCCTRS